MLVTPNRLSVLRIVATPVFISLVVQRLYWYALGVFTLAVFTDFYDGYLARKHDLSSSVGAYLDPIADKVLVVGSFVLFFVYDMVPLWVVMSIVMRDSIVTLLRVYVSRLGGYLQTTWIAKVKTTLQFVALYWVQIEMILAHEQNSILAPLAGVVTPEYRIWLMGAVALMTVLSAWSYLFQGYKVIWRIAQPRPEDFDNSPV